MKKFIAILCGAAMFAACNNSNGGGTVVDAPNFPEVQHIAAVAGESYAVTFTAEEAWSVSLTDESQVYASLTYDGITDMQFYGEAGEYTVVVNIKDGILSYAKDILVNVEISMKGYTNDLAILTIARTPYEVTVTGSYTDGTSTFQKGGHPTDSPFASAPNTYKVTYKGKYAGPGAEMVIEHNFDKLYNYRVYAKRKDSEGNVSFGAVSSVNDDYPWVRITSFGTNHSKFRLWMEYEAEDAVLTGGVGYEAYVNIEDENGDAVVSVYFIYNPAADEVLPPAVELAYPSDATTNGVTFEGAGTIYTLTLSDAALLGDNHKPAALRIEGYQGYSFAQENLQLSYDSALEAYYISMVDVTAQDKLSRENVLTIGTLRTDGYEEYTITVVLDWIE